MVKKLLLFIVFGYVINPMCAARCIHDGFAYPYCEQACSYSY